MKNKLTKTCLVAVTTTCVLGSLVQPAAAESYWCKMFPKFCGSEGTPGGTQVAPEAPGGVEAPAMSPAAPSATPAVDAYKPAPPPEPPAAPAAESPTPASPPPAAPSP